MTGEYDGSNERLLIEARRQKIATFISDTLQPVNKVREEAELQSRAIQDFEAREYQVSAWDALWQAREEQRRRSLSPQAGEASGRSSHFGG